MNAMRRARVLKLSKNSFAYSVAPARSTQHRKEALEAKGEVQSVALVRRRIVNVSTHLLALA